MYNIFQKYTNDLGSQAVIELGYVPTLLSQTIATAITRTLLSSVESYAPVYFVLNNLPNYFNSDFKEKFIEIRTNIENIKVNSQQEFGLQYSGEIVGQLLAKDLTILSSNPVSILNPNQVILTTNSREPMKVNLFIKFEKGVYFRTPEEAERLRDINNLNKSFSTSNDKIAYNENMKSIIFCNSIFSPIIKVRHILTQSNMDNYDNIEFEIQTDGRVTALNAMKYAVELLRDGINNINNSFDNVVIPSNSLSSPPITMEDNSDNIFNRGDSVIQSTHKIKTLEELQLTDQQYNFIKTNYRDLNELSTDLQENGLSNVKKLFQTNNTKYTEEELIKAFEKLNIDILKIKER